MTHIPEYDKFIASITRHSEEIKNFSAKSWQSIDFRLKEVEIVRKYLLEKNTGVDYLNKTLTKKLSHANYEVKFASVFIHQKPRITRHATSKVICKGDTPSCELGDLCVIFCFLDRNKKPVVTRAVIAQAKKHADLDSKSQKCLFDKDILFEMPARIYSNSTHPHPERTLPGYNQSRIKALKYLILKKNPSLRQVPWDSNLEYDWAYFLHRFIIGDVGLAFEIPKAGDNGWNCIINDLLNVGKGAIPSKINRGNALEDVVNLFNHFNEYEKYSVEIDEHEGLSMLFVIVKDNEFEYKS